MSNLIKKLYHQLVLMKSNVRPLLFLLMRVFHTKSKMIR